MEQHRDEHITCAECGTTFVFSAAEAESFASKRLEPPKRCFECRKARRAQKNAGRDGGQFPPRRGGPPRGQVDGDVDGYRAPMSDPAWSRGGRDNEYRAPGFRDGRGNTDRRVGGRGEYRAPAYQNERAPRRNEYRAPAFAGDRGARGNEYRAPGFAGSRGPRGNEYRAPGFGGDPGSRGNDRGPNARRDRGPRGDVDASRRPDRGPRNAPSDRSSGPRRSDRGPHGDHDRGPSRAHAERPSYPITCAQCGVDAEVPFKPQEGREILCRDCYRARKDSAA